MTFSLSSFKSFHSCFSENNIRKNKSSILTRSVPDNSMLAQNDNALFSQFALFVLNSGVQKLPRVMIEIVVRPIFK